MPAAREGATREEVEDAVADGTVAMEAGVADGGEVVAVARLEEVAVT